MHLMTESRSGRIEHAWWVILNSPTKNVIQVRWNRDRTVVVTLWLVGSEEPRALKAWRQCVEGNKGKGFDIKPCESPMPASVGTEST